jgi:flagellar assembly protein FliH
MSEQPHQRFGFDTVFDSMGDALAPVRQKRLYTADEVEQIRKTSHAEGERAAENALAGLQAQALAAIAQICGQALPRLAEVAHEHRVGSADLSLACARVIASAALDRFPEAPVRAALEALAREIETSPRLMVTAAPELAEGLQALLAETAQGIGYVGAIQVRAQAGMTTGAFTLDFGDGAAAFDAEAAAARVAQALDAALAAEGLHAEPLTPAGES